MIDILVYSAILTTVFVWLVCMVCASNYQDGRQGSQADSGSEGGQVMTTEERAREWLTHKRYGNIGYFDETKDIITGLLQRCETLEQERDALNTAYQNVGKLTEDATRAAYKRAVEIATSFDSRAGDDLARIFRKEMEKL